MRKLLHITIICGLLLSGCGNKEDINKEEELREEIRAEIQAELEKVNEEANKVEANNEEDTSTVDTMIDLKDREMLKDYLMNHYDQLNESIIDLGGFVYGDFTNDGQEDVVFYIQNRGEITPVFITSEDNELVSYIGQLEAHYSQDIAFEKDFILYYNVYGGAGISDKYLSLYVFENGQIIYTDASILVEGHTAGVDFMSKRTGEIILDKEGDYRNFTHVEVQTGADEYRKEYRYEYDAANKKFNITTISDSTKKEEPSETEKEASSEVGSNESVKSNYVGPLAKYTSETVYSRDKEMIIDYSKYKLVVIPMQDSINKDLLGKRTIDVTETGTEMQLQLTVLGELIGMTITYNENELAEEAMTKVITVDEAIKDEVITFNVNLPFDFSSLQVDGLYIYKYGVEGFSVNLNDMADETSFEVILIEDDGTYEGIE